jgi:hypothetical protein
LSSPDDDPPKPGESGSASSPPEEYQPVDPATGVPGYQPSGVQPSEPSGAQPSDARPSDARPSDVQPDTASGPILPAKLSDDALQDAVGVRRTKRPETEDRPDNDDDDDDDSVRPGVRKRSRRSIAIAAISIMVGLMVATLVFLGRANAQRYLIVCTATRVTAEQGRGFPPWGSHPLAGPEWKAITLPSIAECKPRETEDQDELGKWYLDMLVERATAILTARNVLETVPVAAGQPAANPLDTAAGELDQALLLARNPDRRDQRKEVERLLGDVEYWRASARLRDASTVLLDAAKQFDTAAAQRPRHVSDAAAWATFLRRLADELHAGPSGTPATPVAPPPVGASPPVTAPPGVALPVEPAGSDSGSASPPPAPDAGVPSGGVLL